MLVFVLIASFRLPLLNLLVLMLPLAAAGALLTLIAPTAPVLPTASVADPLIWHIMISIVAYSILFMAACQSVLLAMLEHRLKAKQTLRFLKLLPPLQTMESLLFGLLWTGIAALTLAIGTGFLFLDDMFEQRVVHHTVLALASWVLYAALLAGHRLLRLAGHHRGALDADRFQPAPAGLSGQQVRDRGAAGRLMSDLPDYILLALIVLLTVLSAFFSSSETAMIGLNRYRLRHLVKEKHNGARIANRLLRRPDRLLGVILLGNNLVNFMAASLGTVIGIRLFGDAGRRGGSGAADGLLPDLRRGGAQNRCRPPTGAHRLHRGLRARAAAAPVLSDGLVHQHHRQRHGKTLPAPADEQEDNLSAEELRTVVNEGVSMHDQGQNMLLGVLDLEKGDRQRHHGAEKRNRRRGHR